MYFQNKSKKAVSVIIGYVLLVTFAIVIGVVVYQWMKTYVPQEELNCPDGSSIFLEDYSYNCDTEILTLYLKNNGKFNLGGYFIYATSSEDAKLATLELSKNNTDLFAKINPMGIKFGEIGTANSLGPDSEEIEEYNLTGIIQIYSIEIIPIRWQEEKNKKILASCKDVKIREVIRCKGISGGLPPDQCIPISCAGRVCGSDGCGGSCPPGCSGTDICNSGVCIPEGTCLDTCASLLFECGTHTICGVDTSCPPGCSGTDTCNLVNGQCECLDTCASLGFECAQQTVCGISTDCGTCNLPNAISDCFAAKCEVSSCDSGWRDCDLQDSNGCEIELGTDTNCASCGDDCTTSGEICVGGVCASSNTCNGVWTGASEGTGIECDGTPLPTNCLADCTCASGYDPNGLGGCEIPNSIVSCGDYCVWLSSPVYIGGSCRQSVAQCTGRGEVHELGGDVLPYCDPSNPLQDTCCCRP